MSFGFSMSNGADSAVAPSDVRGMKRVDDRRVLSGIVHALKCGDRWAACVDAYGPKKTLYNRFVRWAERGLREMLSRYLPAACAPRIWTMYVVCR